MARFGVHETPNGEPSPAPSRTFDSGKLAKAVQLLRKHYGTLRPSEIAFLQHDEDLTYEAARQVQRVRKEEWKF